MFNVIRIQMRRVNNELKTKQKDHEGKILIYTSVTFCHAMFK